MSIQTKPRSFFSTTTGLVTGLAGVGTAAVGVLTLAVQAGWIGDSGDGSSSPSASTSVSSPSVAPGSPGAGGSSATTSAVPDFTVEPLSVTFEFLGTKEARVTVRNQGDAPITVGRPTVTGTDSTQFTATDVDCTRSALNQGRSCEIKVTYAPAASGQHTARLVVEVNSRFNKEVTLRGNRLL